MAIMNFAYVFSTKGDIKKVRQGDVDDDDGIGIFEEVVGFIAGAFVMIVAGSRNGGDSNIDDDDAKENENLNPA